MVACILFEVGENACLFILLDNERQKFIHELFLKGECGKLHFARLVFIGKNGVGKTSLMRRLLWQEKEDVTSTQSTDGIEVEKCNINITNGKWTPCNGKTLFGYSDLSFNHSI